MKQTCPILITTWCYLLLSAVIYGQGKTSEVDYYNWFDRITGIENSNLHYGTVYLERHHVKNKKTKFFPDPDFIKGSVVVDGQPYFDIDLKYNVYDDEVLMRVDNRIGGNILQLNKNKVDNFTVGGYHFTKIEALKTKSKMVRGFYEVPIESSFFILLKKHRKKLAQKLGEKSVFHEFEDAANECFLYYDQDFHPIQKISDLIELFPEHAVHLKRAYENQISRSNFETLLEGLLVYLNSLLRKESHKTGEY